MQGKNSIQLSYIICSNENKFRAYNSPVVLMHSGIGCREHLASVGIDCKVDLPGVGNNLQDHPMVLHLRFIYV